MHRHMIVALLPPYDPDDDNDDYYYDYYYDASPSSLTCSLLGGAGMRAQSCLSVCLSKSHRFHPAATSTTKRA
jgi:hypothetical protein